MTLNLNGETRIFLILGDPIAQVKSPAALTQIMSERGMNALVIPAHVTSADLSPFMAAIKTQRNLDGIIATIPHKIAALDHCDSLTERAKFAGSANVIRRADDGQWIGDNTDGQGYLDGIAQRGFDIKDKGSLLIGAGGAGSAIAYEIMARGAARLAIYDADTERCQTLIKNLNSQFPNKVIEGSPNPNGYDLIANATPVGMRESDPFPVEINNLSASQFVADVITKPEITPLLQKAQELGCKTMTGVEFFNTQSGLLVDKLTTGNP